MRLKRYSATSRYLMKIIGSFLLNKLHFDISLSRFLYGFYLEKKMHIDLCCWKRSDQGSQSGGQVSKFLFLFFHELQLFFCVNCRKIA